MTTIVFPLLKRVIRTIVAEMQRTPSIQAAFGMHDLLAVSHLISVRHVRSLHPKLHGANWSSFID
jgi:hypothetical protein